MFNEGGGYPEGEGKNIEETKTEISQLFLEFKMKVNDPGMEQSRASLIENLKQNGMETHRQDIAEYHKELESSVERSADQSQEMINQIRLDLEIARILFESGYPDKAFEMIDNEEDGILAYAENIAGRDEVCAEFAQKVDSLAALLYQLSEENDH